MPGFDIFPLTYLIPTYLGCWLLLLGLFFRPNRANRWFLPVSLVLLFLLRLPSLWHNNEINPDESQMITQAMTLAQDPVYFRSVDGTTGGPLDSYFLIVPSWVGLPFDYITAHSTALGLILVFLVLMFQAARLWFGSQAARTAVLPLIFLLGLTQNGDFLHYNSELIAIVLLAGATCLLAQQTVTGLSAWLLALTGLLLGMVPFGKLQGVPMAGLIGLFTALYVFLKPSLTVSRRIKYGIALLSGGLAFPVLFVAFMVATGEYSNFVTFYIEGNFNYATGGNQLDNLLHLPRFFGKGTEFAWYVLLTMSLGIAGIVSGVSRQQSISSFGTSSVHVPLWFRGAFLLGLLAVTLYAITRTGSEYVHYLFFLMIPLLLLAAYGYEHMLKAGLIWQRAGQIMVGVYLLAFGVQMVYRYQHNIPLNPYPTAGQGGWKMPKSDLVQQVQRYADPGEKLVVWGWRCDYYVQAQMPQGVAENHTIRSTFAHPMRSIYQQRYVQDFMQSLPPVFVDAVGSQNLWMNDRKTQGYELIKPLHTFVATHYRYVGLANDARLYVRLDRLRSKNPVLFSRTDKETTPL